MDWPVVLTILFVAVQLAYSLAILSDLYLFTLPINRVDMSRVHGLSTEQLPEIILFYPVLNELEATMRTTFLALAQMDYPRERYRVVAIPNHDDAGTIASLRRLQNEFDFVDLIEVPPTSDTSWQPVWDAWDENEKVYWWHRGPRAQERALPPKKTRQLIYAFYQLVSQRTPDQDFLLNYIDADSVPPRDHFLAGAAGMRDYDVLQSTNIAGNLNASMSASWHAFDHMTWDGRKYLHLSANGRQPFWVLGKGLFFRASDLVELGGFHPWITIEDPEVGLRFWKNGKRLGIIEAPLIEEVPETLGRGITQRKRWVAGFFQTLDVPLKEMGFTRRERVAAWMNFLPCLSLWINAIGIPVGIWAIIAWWTGTSPLPFWTVIWTIVNVGALLLSLLPLYWSIWKRGKLVLPRKRDRLWYLLRVNPLSLILWWTIWVIPLFIGWRMYRKDTGLVWERTEKIDANADLVRATRQHHVERAEQRI